MNFAGPQYDPVQCTALAAQRPRFELLVTIINVALENIMFGASIPTIVDSLGYNVRLIPNGNLQRSQKSPHSVCDLDSVTVL